MVFVRRAALATALVVVAVSGCSSPSGSGGDRPAGDAPSSPEPTDAAPVGDIGDAVEVAAGAPAGADAAACDVDRRTLETASEVYLAMNGTAPADVAALAEQQLVDPDSVAEVATRFTIAADGSVVAVAGGPCG